MISVEMVHAAADEIDASGVKVGPKNVRERLGDTGSYTTIVKALETWRSRRDNSPAVPFEMPGAARAVLERLSEAAWEAAARAATAHFDGQRAELQNGADALRADLADARDTVQHLVAENSGLENELTIAKDRAAKLHDEVVALKAQVELLKEVRPAGVTKKRRPRKSTEESVVDAVAMVSAAQALSMTEAAKV